MQEQKPRKKPPACLMSVGIADWFTAQRLHTELLLLFHCARFCLLLTDCTHCPILLPSHCLPSLQSTPGTYSNRLIPFPCAFFTDAVSICQHYVHTDVMVAKLTLLFGSGWRDCLCWLDAGQGSGIWQNTK